MSGAIVGMNDVANRPHVEVSADVVVIGSGAAGATVARVLSDAGLETIVLEEGSHVPTDALRGDMYSSFKNLWRDMGFQVARGRAFTPILQGCCVGGTTAVNGAIVHRLPESIYDTWSKEHGFSDAVSYADLERVWDRLDTELSVGPAPDAVFGRNNALMERGVEALGISGNRIRRNVDGCRGAGRCNQGCPTARRQSMNNSFIPRAIAFGARVYANCRVDRIVTRHGRATGVEGRFTTGERRGPRMRAHARRAVVVAASAIQTPRLLLDNGIGRRSKKVGRRLQAHPGTGVAGIFDEPVRQWSGATQGYETTHYWNERMKFETVGMPLEFGALRLPGLGPNLMHQLADYGHVGIWGVQVRARAHGRVRRGLLGGTSITYDATTEDVRALKLGVKRLVAMMFAAGATKVMPGIFGLPEVIEDVDEIEPIFDLPDDPRIMHCIAAHLFGTAVMGPEPTASVVAPTGEAHDLNGLYVADSSVFPTNMGVNPQHTIAAVAWLTAERIAARALA